MNNFETVKKNSGKVFQCDFFCVKSKWENKRKKKTTKKQKQQINSTILSLLLIIFGILVVF